MTFERVEPVSVDTASAEQTSIASIETEVPTPAPIPAEPRPRFIDRFKNRPVKAPVSVEEPVPAVVFSAEPAPEPVAFAVAVGIKPEKPSRGSKDRDPMMSLDSAAGDIRFRLSYGGLVAIGFIFVMLLAIAFIAGTKMSVQTAAEDFDPTAKSPTTAPTSGLMAAVDPPDAGSDAVKPISSVPVQADVLSLPSHPAKPAVATPSTNPPTPSLPIKTTRDIGMVYVVIQSYAEQELAQKACDFMNHAGIPCSLVQGPANWAPRDWYSVVGLQPFAKHDPNLSEYERSVRALGVKFTSHAIDQFQPAAYTWREDSDLSQQ